MDALLTTFIAATLAEFGDKTQLLVIALAARYRNTGAVLLGIAVAALANALLAGAGGALVNDMIVLRASSLLVALALLFAGVAGLVRQTDESEMGLGWKTGAFVTTAACFFLLEFADKTQFLTFALAAQYDAMGLAVAGATAGVLAASIPAVLLAERLPQMLPLPRIRTAVSILFLVTGSIVAVNALRLV